jgi:bis(5'-nucleosyl)-tetraphosphatase (symmetrical)
MRYVIGDIHGCWETLQRLLDQIDYDRGRDRLWLVGDLVNGGPESLKVVRWARELGDNAVVVPGNHDLHMLAVAHGAHEMREDDTFRAVLEAPESGELVEWMMGRPMTHQADGYRLVHAGVHPSWSTQEVATLARELEGHLRGGEAGGLLDRMYGDEPPVWSESLAGIDRWRFVINAMTRMRAVRPEDGGMDFSYKGTLEEMPLSLEPWFRARRRGREAVDELETVVFGHWSALGPHRAPGAVCLDGGCVWGDRLVAMRLEDEQLFSVPSELPEVSFD